MRKFLSMIISMVLVLTVLISSLAITAFSETTSVNKLVAFGDSVIFGACMGSGPNTAADAYGDQKVTDLIGKEFGLTRYTSIDKIKSDNAEKWFFNNSMSGATTDYICNNQVKTFDSELLAQADLIYMNGGTNDACSTMSQFLGGCSWGSTCADWTLEETKTYIENNSSTMNAIARMVKANFIDILTYITSLEGFNGKIVIQNYPNQYAASENTNAEYLWDEFYERTINCPQREAIEEVSQSYSNIYQLDVTTKVRNGAKYTGVTYGDSQHLTFDGNRAIYKELSLLLNPDGANLLTFESTEIPENAVWRTAYDFEQYNVGDTNIPGVLETGSYNDVEIADISETYLDDETPRDGTNSSSAKVLKCNDTKQLSVDLSSYTANAYGIRYKITAVSSTFKYWEYSAPTKSFLKQNLPMNTDKWATVEMKAGYSGMVNWYSTIINISDIQTMNALKVWPANGTCYYIDDIEILTTDESLPEAPTTTTTTTKSTTTTTTTTTTTVSGSTTTTTAASSGTETELPFSEDYFTLSDNTAGLSFTTASEGYKMIAGSLPEGKGVTLTSTVKLEPGVYDTTVYARARATRPPFDIEVNGTVIGEAVDTSNTVLGTDNNAPVSLASVTIPSATYITIKITGSAGASGWLYLNSIKFTKTADYVADTNITDAISTQDKASIRLGDVNGIRFYTTVDEDKLGTLVNGQTYEIGTLIGPKDLIGDELTIDDFTDGNALNVEYKYKENGNISLHEEADFKGIVGSIVGIKESNTSFNTAYGNINRDFVARGYVKVGDTYYYSLTSSTRSLGFIASEYVNNGNTDNANANRWAEAYNAK